MWLRFHPTKGVIKDTYMVCPIIGMRHWKTRERGIPKAITQQLFYATKDQAKTRCVKSF